MDKIIRWGTFLLLMGAALGLWLYSLIANIGDNNLGNIFQCVGLLFGIGVFGLIIYLSASNKWNRFLRAVGRGDINVPNANETKSNPNEKIFTRQKVGHAAGLFCFALFGIGMIIAHHFITAAQGARPELAPMLYLGIAFAVVPLSLAVMVFLPEGSRKGTFLAGVIFTVFPLMLFMSMANQVAVLGLGGGFFQTIKEFPFTMFFIIFTLLGVMMLVTGIVYIIKMVARRR